LAAVSFYAEPFADAVTSIADAALTFLMCHNKTVSKSINVRPNLRAR
jgi:hypothetical protein